MNIWKNINKSNIVSIKRIIEFEKRKEPINIYADRYLVKPDSYMIDNAIRYSKEVFLEFKSNSSIFILGSGHCFFPNYYCKLDKKNYKITAMDLANQASVGLYDCVNFIKGDFLKENIGNYDYIFSSHTIEHFTRDQILNEVLPKCWNIVRKGFVFIVPYRNIGWGKEPNHKVELQENDELAAQASKYKIVYGNKELILWFEK